MRKLNNFNIVCIILLWCFLCYLVITENKELAPETWIYMFFSGAFVFIPIWKHYRKKGK